MKAQGCISVKYKKKEDKLKPERYLLITGEKKKKFRKRKVIAVYGLGVTA